MSILGSKTSLAECEKGKLRIATNAVRAGQMKQVDTRWVEMEGASE